MSMVAAVIVAAGRGERAGGAVPKQYRPVAGAPAIRATLAAFCGHPQIDVVQPVIHLADAELFGAAQAGLGKLAKPVQGGATRQISVHSGLNALQAHSPDLVLIHDAARPFVTAALIDRAIEAARRHGAAVPGLAVADTVKVVDQDGTSRRFYSDLIKDKVVILSFFFTSCQSTCPAMTARLKKLQADLGQRLGKDVFIVTVSKDPETDTPTRLKAFANSLKIKPGWTMITGDVKAMGKIVYDFTGDRLGQDSHNTIFLIGNDKNGSWADLSGYASVDELRQQIEAVSKI